MPLPAFPSPPSPTLTNPEMVLPNDIERNLLSSPPRAGRPPSPSYLYDKHDNTPSRLHKPQSKNNAGLASKKKAFQRSKGGHAPGLKGESHCTWYNDQDLAFESSPILKDPETLSHQQVVAAQDSRRFSDVSSVLDSDDLESLTPGSDDTTSDSGTAEDEGSDSGTLRGSTLEDSPTVRRHSRRQSDRKAEETSAALSRRAELILANAKKRLNVGTPTQHVNSVLTNLR